MFVWLVIWTTRNVVKKLGISNITQVVPMAWRFSQQAFIFGISWIWRWYDVGVEWCHNWYWRWWADMLMWCDMTSSPCILHQHHMWCDVLWHVMSCHAMSCDQWYDMWCEMRSGVIWGVMWYVMRCTVWRGVVWWNGTGVVCDVIDDVIWNAV